MESMPVSDLVNVSADFAFGLNPTIEGVHQLFPGQKVRLTTGQAFKQAQALREQYKGMVEIVPVVESPLTAETPDVPAVEVPPSEAVTDIPEVIDAPSEGDMAEDAAPEVKDAPVLEESVADVSEDAPAEDAPAVPEKKKRPARRSEQ